MQTRSSYSHRWTRLLVLLLFVNPGPVFAADSILPDGVKAVWDIDQAYHETTATRERICLNGLWRWQPAETKAEQIPEGSWGYFKVPGCWPGITDYLQKDSQTVFENPDWNSVRLRDISAAWYEREISVPTDWSGRRIALATDTLNSFASVFVDGLKAGELHFPGGELDLTSVCKPGSKHRLSLLVVALPLKGVMLSYVDTAAAREVKGTVERRGLCGDVFLASTPAGPKIDDIRVDTSFRKKELSINVAVEGLVAAGHYQLQARVMRGGAVVKEFTSPAFQGTELKDGRFEFKESWLPDRLWDLNTPTNQFDLQLSLADAGGKLLDTDWIQQFGFREFWIDGRDFYLNGSRIFLSSVPLDNAQVGASMATYAAARESFERLKNIGINYVYTHNYGCEPGAHLSFTEILRAADDVGMLVGLTQPHFSHFDWKSPDADTTNGYARIAKAYTEMAGNHPSVVFYVMSHNATGYDQDMNPDMLDGIQDSRDQWALRNVKLAMRAEAIVKNLDPRRIVYHHASGNLGVMDDMNFYPNFAPVQELDDWFGHWAKKGVKPAFTCEYGAPFTWDWTMYRGWYDGKREWGSAQVPWEFCLAEWNAQFLGDRAYQISDAEKQDLRWEAKQFHAGRVWHRWDYPNPVGSDRFDERYPIFAKYLTDNWRAYRTWGVSGISPWEFGHYWKLRPGVDRSRKELPVDWENLQRPGFSPDYVDERYERMDTAFERSDWMATPAAQALMRNNRPLLAYIAGKQDAFTSKDHNFLPGELVEKQIVLINNSRSYVSCVINWSFSVPNSFGGNVRSYLAPGEQHRFPLRIDLPADLKPGGQEIQLKVEFDNGEVQEDQFIIDVLADPGSNLLPRQVPQGAGHASESTVISPRIALFDPDFKSSGTLSRLKVRTERVSADENLSDFGILIIGKAALTVDGPVPDLSRVRDGLKVIVFEQTAEALEQRLGFRATEYGLRQVFPRVPDHPILAGITQDNLHDWRGASTIVPPELTYPLESKHGKAVDWAGLPETRVWRCGNRGDVATVLIEKPACGDFLPIVDGGFSLQFSPLMEYHEGRGLILFCQLDVTGRTENDPAAEILTRNIIRYVADWKPAAHRPAVYAGNAAGRKFLESMGIEARPLDSHLDRNEVLVIAPGASQTAGQEAASIAGFVKAGGNVLAVGLDQEEANAVLPIKIATHKAEHISTWFEAPGVESLFAGIGPANLHNRDPREFPLVTGSAETLGDGVLARTRDANVVFLQMTPWTFSREQSFRRTFRQTSVMLDRLLANLGVAGSTPLLGRFQKTVEPAHDEKRWLHGFYLDQPEEWDDPYRFFRW